MAAFLAAMVTLSLGGPAPLEPHVTDALRKAQRYVRSSDRYRGLAMLDSLVMSDGVTVSLDGPSEMISQVDRGFEIWNLALREPIFRMRPSGGTDVVVRFVRSLDEEGNDIQGVVKASREFYWSDRDRSYRLRATILVRDNVDGRAVSPEEAASVVAHEAGHLLGLADVNRTDRLMGPLVPGQPQYGPTHEEADAVRTYRTLIRESYPKRVDKR